MTETDRTLGKINCNEIEKFLFPLFTFLFNFLLKDRRERKMIFVQVELQEIGCITLSYFLVLAFPPRNNYHINFRDLFTSDRNVQMFL